jgi:Carboxypeptidase regulatory-like domain
MQTHSLSIAVLAIVVTLPHPASAQVAVERSIQIGPGSGGAGSIQFPGMGGPRQFKTGTGRIRGRVLASDGAGPIRRAQVRISGNDVAPKVALTDAEGRFEFRDLPASRFTIMASKSGFVSVQYGQTRPFESGKPIELGDRQALDNADVSLPRGSVISGRIFDEFGDPLPDVSVTAMRQTWANGGRRLMPSPGRIAQTNDLGQFRIYGLPPGEYFVSASLRGGAALEVAEMELMITTGGASPSAGPTASTPRSGYAPTYYPGTPNAPEAQKITLAAGQDMSSADFGLVAVRLAKVSGIVVSSDGKPVEGAAINLLPAGGREMGLMLGPGGGRTSKDGTFTLSNVAPGDYTLQARSVQVITSPQGDNMMVFRAASIGGGDSEFGSTPLSVGGEDISNLLLTTSKGATAIGQVTFDGPKPPASSVRLMSIPVDSDGGPSIGGGFGAVKEDGTFELKGLTGTRLIRAGGTPPGWTLTSVKLNGVDITDSGAEFKPGETVSGLEVELSARSTTVTGAVTAADGSVLKDYTVVVFSEEPEHWKLPVTRWVTGTRPDQDGRFKVQNLPAGAYYAAAVEYIPQGEWGDPDILDRLRSKARRFRLGEGGTEMLDLKLSDF